MAELSKQALKVENNTEFPNNNNGQITPTRLRTFNEDMIDSTVNQTQYSANSASWNADIDALQNFSSSLDTNFASQAEFEAFTASADGRLDSLEAATSSYATSAITASSLVTASFNNGTRNLTFTKGDASTFAVNIPDVSGSTINTGSFATTGSNTFTGIQNFTSEITASNTLISGDLTVNPTTSTKLNGNTDIGSFLYVGGGLTLNSSAAISWLGSGIIDSTFSQSVDARINAITGSGTTNTGSLLVTASASGADITFTKGDASTFTITVATGSAVSASYAETASLAINAKDIVVDVKNTTGLQINKGTVVRIIGATGDIALIGTASWENDSVSANTLGFVVDNIANDAFGRVMTQGTLLGINTDPALGYTAGQLIYLSSSGQYTNVPPPAPFHEVRLGQVLRAQQNNGSIYVLVQNGYELTELHDVDINTGSLANKDILAYDSASQQWENWSINGLGLAITGSNTFTGNQTVNGFVSASNGFESGPNTTALLIGENSNMRFYSGSNNDSYYNVQLVPGIGDIAFSRGGASNIKTFTLGGVEGNATTFQNNPVQIQGTVTALTINAQSTAISGSGSYSVQASTITETATSATIAASASVLGTFGLTGQSGGDGKAIMLGHSGSLVLGNSTTNTYYGAMGHISSSAANANTNLIFKNSTTAADTIVSGSANIFANPAAPTTGFKRYVGTSNIFTHGNSVPQISGSMAWSPTFGGNIISHTGTNAFMWRGPVSSSAATINHNIIMGGTINLGSSAANNFEKATAGVQVLGNAVFAGNVNVVANTTTLTSTPVVSGNLVFGALVNLNMYSSSVTYASNIQNGGITINNSFSPTAGTVAGALNMRANVNTVYGTGHVVNVSGTNTSTTQGKAFSYNILAGTFISASIPTGDNSAIIATGIIGNGLVVTGSTLPSTFAGPDSSNNSQGSLFSGRYNAIDGTKSNTGETIFAVGTGTSYANRKTGFLIDSGSNTYVEGSLNVSGSSSFTGSVSISTTMKLGASDPLPSGEVGMLAVSASHLWFYNGAWTQLD